MGSSPSHPTHDGATFGDELQTLREHLDLTTVHVLSQPPGHWTGERGRITATKSPSTPGNFAQGMINALVGYTGPVRRQGEFEQIEGDPLLGAQSFEDDQQGEPDLVALLGLGSRADVGVDEVFGQPHAGVGLARHAGGLEHVEAEPAGHRGEPAAQIADLVVTGPRVAQPGLLHDILRLGDTAEHPVGDRDEMRSFDFEGFGGGWHEGNSARDSWGGVALVTQ